MSERRAASAREADDSPGRFGRHPGVLLAAAAGAGALIGAVSAGRGARARARLRARAAEAAGAAALGPPARPAGAPKVPWRERGPKSRELANTWERASEALLGVIIGKALDLVSRVVPGFRDQFDTRGAGTLRR